MPEIKIFGTSSDAGCGVAALRDGARITRNNPTAKYKAVLNKRIGISLFPVDPPFFYDVRELVSSG
jgi:hypothetical protein